MVRIEPELSRSQSDEDYWLSNCEGFRVECPTGRLGTVERVLVGQGDRPEQLSVCCGIFRLRTMLIPVDDVAAIAPRELRLRVRHAPNARAARVKAPRRVLHPLRG
jgi:hypothetical protein